MNVSFSTVTKLAISSFVAFILFMAYIATAEAEGPVVDPTITPNMTLTCKYPLKRENGDDLAINEIARVDFFVSTSLTTPNWQPAGSNTNECKQIYDLTQVADGQYYYTGTTIDTEARQSILGSDSVPAEYWAMVVKRQANPRHQTGFTATFN